MEEVSAAYLGHDCSTWPILQSEPPRDEEAVQMPFSVVMPTGGHSARNLGPRHDDPFRLERLLPGNSLRRVPGMKVSLVKNLN